MFRALALRQSKRANEGLTLETSASTIFTAFSISTSTLRWYIVRFTAMPMQTKTSSHRDYYSIVPATSFVKRLGYPPLALTPRHLYLVQSSVVFVYIAPVAAVAAGRTVTLVLISNLEELNRILIARLTLDPARKETKIFKSWPVSFILFFTGLACVRARACVCVCVCAWTINEKMLYHEPCFAYA